jgi:hypothetical protein
MTKGVKGKIEYLNHKGQTLLVSYTYFKGAGSERGESPTQIELDHVLGWFTSLNMRDSLSKEDIQEIEEIIYDKELYNAERFEL